MELIQNNPYRIAGILSNSSAKELQEQKGKIKAFAKVGKEITSELDFDLFDNIERTEQTIDKAFLNVEQNEDKEKHFFELLWFKVSGSVRLLVDNKFAYKQSWDAQRGEKVDWARFFNQSKLDSRNYLAHQQVPELLGVVLDRLYTVRNQLIHGGTIYNSKVNPYQVKDAGQILEFLKPILIDITLENINDD